MAQNSFSLEDFGSSFKGFMDQMAASAPTETPVFLEHLRRHFAADPQQFPVVSEDFPQSDHANVQTAVDAYVKGKHRSATLLGITGDAHSLYMGVTMAQLVASAGGGLWGGKGPTSGPVQYVNISLEGDSVLPCVQNGLFLIEDGTQKLAVLMRGPNEMGIHRKVTVEVMAPEREDAERFLRHLRTAMRKRNVYRGRVISLEVENHDIKVKFHRLPRIESDGIILPAGLLRRIERQTIGFARHSNRLRAAGRHLKRGLLLYGPPGTGKTLTAMYLAGQLKDRTIILLTGRGLGLVEKSCALARALQPAILILEDVDLIAEERTHQNAACNTVLFELLNQMDGLAEDVDALFLLTTNRPDILEPALAARPGRIDQAIEIPLPDAACRRRLFELYGQGLALEVREVDRLIDRTQGASAAFMRELMRKAALFAADETDPILVTDRHLDEAMHELLVDGGPLTKSLLGVTQ
ncbi:MAG: ATP-binding protein [Blastocatellia bacterium]|nr:ATP-binding protein [Blastocatellia bacterium]